MLQIQLLRENPEEVIARLKVKNFDATELVQNILELDTQLRQMKKNLDNNLMEQGKIAKSIGQMFKEGRREEAEQMKAQTAELKVQEKELQAELDEKGQKINEMMVLLPNMPHILLIGRLENGRRKHQRFLGHRFQIFEKSTIDGSSVCQSVSFFQQTANQEVIHIFRNTFLCQPLPNSAAHSIDFHAVGIGEITTSAAAAEAIILIDKSIAGRGQIVELTKPKLPV